MTSMVIGGLILLFNMCLIWWMPLRSKPGLGLIVVASSVLAGIVFGAGFGAYVTSR